MRQRLLGLTALATFGALALNAAPVHAATTCAFDVRGKRMALRADCETDASILVPDGFTLDGRGHSIVAVDPPGGHFLGAIVRNAAPGATMNVRNVVIEARALVSVCDPSGPPDLRLAGILIEDGSGSVRGSRVLGINQGQSGCQEGTAIAVRASSGAESTARSVRITGNRVEGYQKTGILVNGNADAVVELNVVTGLGPVDFIGQNGIQLGLGARGRVVRNHISQNLYTQTDAASAGVLLLNAGIPVEITGNAIEDCDVGVRLVSTSEAVVENNLISSSTYDAIAVDGSQGESSGSLIVGNRLFFNAVGIGLYGEGAQLNLVEDNVLSSQTNQGVFVDPAASDNGVRGNRVLQTQGTGITVAGNGNAIEGNRVLASSVLDIANLGADNEYTGNRCVSSSGPPVDCP